MATVDYITNHIENYELEMWRTDFPVINIKVDGLTKKIKLNVDTFLCLENKINDWRLSNLILSRKVSDDKLRAMVELYIELFCFSSLSYVPTKSGLVKVLWNNKLIGPLDSEKLALYHLAAAIRRGMKITEVRGQYLEITDDSDDLVTYEPRTNVCTCEDYFYYKRCDHSYLKEVIFQPKLVDLLSSSNRYKVR